ncbi:DNA polymerase III subunit delta' [Fructilactobacillus ixorae]|uniref:DNA polymerase III subunit delta n=1 Tax=Fructilactobacillus ixorae TaxID=1750535 RepID=A0ABY5C652_9LACO|nr:DNA polymerase III subunit delta' [Fructilactobacillus ixorae]USS93600.1 DNA polymerase III subunit delta' [Fructilactobacillus ixorae]
MKTKTASTIIATALQKQPELVRHFGAVVQAGALSHAYLFSGATGRGKLVVSQLVAMSLFCEHPDPAGLPCGQCNECVRIANGEHPDVLTLKPDGQSIKIDQVRQLKGEFSKSAVEGKQKVFIIDAADTMTVAAANSLLKVIEEPTATVTAILLTTDYHHMLPTIRSRTQLVEFPPIQAAELIRYLQAQQVSATDMTLALKITNDTDELDQLVTDHWLSKMKQQLETWFTWIKQGDAQAFPFIQTNVLPLVKDRFSQNVTITMICLLFQDLFDVKFRALPATKLAFGNAYDLLKSAADQLSDEQIVSMINDILTTAQQQQVNVGFQSILEVITLQCLATIN